VFLEQGTTYRVDVEGAQTGGGTSTNPKLAVLDSNQVERASNDDRPKVASDAVNILNSRLHFTPDNSGYYYLSVEGSGDATGTYDLSVKAIPDYDGLSHVLEGAVASQYCYFLGEVDFRENVSDNTDAPALVTHSGLDLSGNDVNGDGAADVRTMYDGTAYAVTATATEVAGVGYAVIVEDQRSDYPHVFGDGPGTFYTACFHMADAPDVAVGDTVVAGATVLRQEGATGTGGEHLHLEVRDFGTWYYADGAEWGINGSQNVYGGGDMSDSAVLAEHWRDPLELLNLEQGASSSVAVTANDPGRMFVGSEDEDTFALSTFATGTSTISVAAQDGNAVLSLLETGQDYVLTGIEEIQFLLGNLADRIDIGALLGTTSPTTRSGSRAMPGTTRSTDLSRIVGWWSMVGPVTMC
jgi:murein DD-endopeptidase MepM/ murein hydrolase activator NlpD